MANIQYSGLVNAIRGSIKGTTFSRAGGMSVVKGKAKPPKPNQALQNQAKLNMALFAVAWKSLTIGDRVNWNNYASTVIFTDSLGQHYQINGMQMFVRNSMFLSLRGTVVAAVDPSGTGFPASLAPTLTYSAGDVIITAWTGPTVAGTIFRGSLYQPTTQSRSRPQTRVYQQFSVDDFTVPLTIATGYAGPFASGADLRGFVVGRVMDQNSRLSENMLFQFDFTK